MFNQNNHGCKSLNRDWSVPVANVYWLVMFVIHATAAFAANVHPSTIPSANWMHKWIHIKRPPWKAFELWCASLSLVTNGIEISFVLNSNKFGYCHVGLLFLWWSRLTAIATWQIFEFILNIHEMPLVWGDLLLMTTCYIYLMSFLIPKFQATLV